MTLVIGSLCANGMVFCSDTEEGTGGGGKRYVHKIFEFHGDRWEMLVGTAGFGPLCEIAVNRIQQAVKADGFIENSETQIQQIMTDVYQKFVPKTLSDWKQQDRQISLVIGVMNRQSGIAMSLYQTTEEILHPVQHHFACAGVGQEIAYYLLDRLFDPSSKYHEAHELLTFVMREAKASVGNVGGNTEMLTIGDSGGTLRETFGPGWESRQPRLADHLKKFWMDKE